MQKRIMNLLENEEILKQYNLVDLKEIDHAIKHDLILTIEANNKEVNNFEKIYSILHDKLIDEDSLINFSLNIRLFKCKIGGTIEEVSDYIIFAEECDISINTDNIVNNNIASNCQISDAKFKKCKFDKIYINKSKNNYILFQSNENIIENLRIEDVDNNIGFKFILEKVGLKFFSIKNSIFNDDFLVKNNFEQDTMLFITNTTFEKNFFYSNSNSRKNFFTKNINFNGNVNFTSSLVNETHLEEVYFDEGKTIDFTGFTILSRKEVSSKTFRKIKHYLEKQSNKIEANKYHSYEMKARRRELKYIGNVEEKIVFFLNDNVSNHGLSWLLSLFWMTVIGLFYSGIYMTPSYLNIVSNKCTYILILVTILSYFSMNFIINIEENKEKKMQNISALKMALAYYIINFIRFCIPIICALYFYYNINGLDLKPFFKFINVMDFSKSNDFEVSYEAKTISKLIMIYLIYHFVIALRRDNRR